MTLAHLIRLCGRVVRVSSPRQPRRRLAEFLVPTSGAVPPGPKEIRRATIISSTEGDPHAIIDTRRGDRFVVPMGEVVWEEFCAFVRSADHGTLSKDLAAIVGLSPPEPYTPPVGLDSR